MDDRVIRFWQKVKRGDGCWEWVGSKTAAGYGVSRWEGGKKRVAHRIAWQLTNGAIPDGMQLCHRCDNPPCVRPDHLFVGTIADNMADRDAKGRQARGERMGPAKLTAAQVEQIRSSVGSCRAVGAQFGVSRQQVSFIRRRLKWKHLA